MKVSSTFNKKYTETGIDGIYIQKLDNFDYRFFIDLNKVQDNTLVEFLNNSYIHTLDGNLMDELNGVVSYELCGIKFNVIHAYYDDGDISSRGTAKYVVYNNKLVYVYDVDKSIESSLVADFINMFIKKGCTVSEFKELLSVLGCIFKGKDAEEFEYYGLLTLKEDFILKDYTRLGKNKLFYVDECKEYNFTIKRFCSYCNWLYTWMLLFKINKVTNKISKYIMFNKLTYGGVNIEILYSLDDNMLYITDRDTLSLGSLGIFKSITTINSSNIDIEMLAYENKTIGLKINGKTYKKEL